MIGLKYTTYSDGWYNVTGKQYIETKSKRIDLEPGLYNFNDLNNFFLTNLLACLWITPMDLLH